MFNILDKVLPDLPWYLAQGHLLEVGPWAGCRHKKAALHWHRDILHACPRTDQYMLHSSPTAQYLSCADRKGIGPACPNHELFCFWPCVES